MPDLTPQGWLVLALVFLLGLLIGMALMAGGKWKARYREELRKREALEVERSRLESQLKHAEARGIAAHARDGRPVDGGTHTHTPIA